MCRTVSKIRSLATAILSAGLLFLAALPAQAQSLIRDTEIEETLRQYTDPILRAANLQSSSVDLFIVNDKSLNAFVTRGQNIFVHTGLILEADTPNQLKGVLAHEAGHIAAGHLARRDQSNRSAYGSMLIAAGLGLAAILAGEGQAGAAILAGSTQFGTIDVLAHSRINEASADQAAASYLEITGQSGAGLVEFFEKFRYQEVFSQSRRYPYFRGHPLSSDRIDKLREVTSESPFAKVTDTDAEITALIMAKAKLIGFIDAPQIVFSKYPETDDSKPARYARAVAYYRAADLTNAIKTIDSLIADEPENPYFYELKGQIYYESGKGADAIEPMIEAVRLKPSAALLEIALAQALIEGGTPAQIEQSIDLLKSALRKENTNGFAWYLLSQSYDRQGEPALARYAIAEQSFAMGNYQRARSFAQRAQEGLGPHKAQLRRANDIIVISAAQMSSQKKQMTLTNPSTPTPIKTRNFPETPMRALFKSTTAVTLALVLASLAGCAEAGQTSKSDVEKIVKEYLLENPEIIREALVVLQEREDQQSIVNVAKELRNDPRDFSIGPADAKVTMVEFFDYNCTYCKKSTGWIQDVIKKYPNDVRVVFKELPILDGRTRTSRNAAKAAMAAQKQGKYMEMHLALMDSSVLSKDFIIKTAKKLELDMEKFEADLKDKANDAQLEAALILANRIPGLTGTPFFVINDEFLASGNTRALQLMLDNALKESS